MCDLLLSGNFRFACLQECGFKSDVVPPSVAEVLRRAGFHMRCAGSRSNPASSVAIVIPLSWTFAKVFRTQCESPSAQALGAEITDGACSVFVASIKLPPNLDPSCSRWQGDPDQQCARRLCGLVLAWARPYTAPFLTGDFNTTASCCLDRHQQTPCAPNCSGVRAGNVVSEVILLPEHGFGDAFRDAHPAEPGFTRGQARLDYIFAPRQLLADGARCSVMSDSFSSDHDPVEVSVLVPGNAGPRRSPRWAAPRPLLERASPSQRLNFSRAAGTAAESLIASWSTAPADADELQRRQASFALEIFRCARRTLPMTDSRRPPRRRRPAWRLRALIAALRRMLHIVASVDNLWSCAPRDRRFTKVARRLRLVHPQLPPGDAGLPTWRAWAEGPGHQALSAAERRLRDRNRACPRRGDSRLSEGLWRRNRSRRSFFDRYFRHAHNACLESAIDPLTGRRTFEPERCKALTAQVVSAPFCLRVPLGEGSASEANCANRCVCPCDAHRAAPAGDSCERADPEPLTRPCADVRCLGGCPDLCNDWYGARMQAHACPDLAPEDFADVLAPISAELIVEVLAACSSDTAAGHDGLSAGLLKLAVCRLEAETVEPHGHDPNTSLRPAGAASALALLSSWAFELGIQTPHVTRGLVRMLPKEFGQDAPDAGSMRPITLLSEVGKVPSRVIARRLNAAFAAKPSLLHPAQRAFIANGDTSQCIGTVVDILEDFNASKRAAGGQLHVVAYDVAKAFDAVQMDSLRATLRRFLLPSAAVDYICSGLIGASSSVITAYGPTLPFDVLSSVRQGDPLAPLLYIMFMDVLHRGLHALTSEHAGAGYAFSSDRALCVASSGFADDLVTFAESSSGMVRMHDWVRTFFGMHATRINETKTKYFCSLLKAAPRRAGPSPNLRRHTAATPASLHSVCGRTLIRPRPPSESFRYLGVRICIDLSWTDELVRLNALIWQAAHSILDHRMKLAPAADAIRSFLIPRLEAGLTVMHLTTSVMKKLKTWSSVLRSAALRAHGGCNSICAEAFCFVTRIPDLQRHARLLRTDCLYQRLCLGPEVLPPTTPLRLRAMFPGFTLSQVLSKESDGAAMMRRQDYKINRWAATLWGPDRLPLRLQANDSFTPIATKMPVIEVDPSELGALGDVRTEWRPSKEPCALFSTPGARDYQYDIFTDGSTPCQGAGVSGYAAVIFDARNRNLKPITTSLWLKCSGNNFLAEMCAIAAGLLAVPARARVCVFSDSLSCILAVRRDDTAEKRRLRAAARPMLSTLRRIIASRTGEVTLEHVRAHTGASDFVSTANALADDLANKERCAANRAGARGTPFVFNEERVIAGMALAGHVPELVI